VAELFVGGLFIGMQMEWLLGVGVLGFIGVSTGNTGEMRGWLELYWGRSLTSDKKMGEWGKI
jgi:hypothetical protein